MSDLVVADGGGRALVNRADAEVCRAWIREHSRSFYLSSLLLPKRVRLASWALYAFCRRADDAVDEGSGESLLLRRVEGLRARLDQVERGDAGDDSIDRSYGLIAARHGIPRALPEALLAGMEMDARGTRYATMEELYLYCFRVASTVGLMMARVMGWSRPDAILRAADLGLAMQLTNIARDVGEDARRGRVYLPDELLSACGIDRQAVLSATEATGPIREATKRLLLRADDHYRAADRGVPLLPKDCRLAIAASRRIYSAIGDDSAAHGFDSVTRRAHTGLAKKLVLVARSLPSVWSAPAPPAEGPADALLGPLVRACGFELP